MLFRAVPYGEFSIAQPLEPLDRFFETQWGDSVFVFSHNLEMLKALDDQLESSFHVLHEF